MSTDYHVPGIPPTTTPDEIKRAYHKCMMANHSDKTVRLPNDEREKRVAKAKQAVLAWEGLRNPEEKRRYDIRLPRDMFYSPGERQAPPHAERREYYQTLSQTNPQAFHEPRYQPNPQRARRPQAPSPNLRPQTAMSASAT
ncbi:hypothetical protein K458DRAFT_455135 [Lentithecium fluviatile CBS 122367]|uniref:J domain-containing protein n=1 Tax=Lentithecium fluviatile CBS 122367 TaxID=1168545 RepID=A0A6G1JL19_9PLEO|nr:hypothetical protein K458DRAFT_455135 [Lentithecium fluviatile CBS 122367]